MIFIKSSILSDDAFELRNDEGPCDQGLFLTLSFLSKEIRVATCHKSL